MRIWLLHTGIEARDLHNSGLLWGRGMEMGHETLDKAIKRRIT